VLITAATLIITIITIQNLTTKEVMFLIRELGLVVRSLQLQVLQPQLQWLRL
jgi:hypothetical protein